MELLAPAGDLEKLKFAVEYGADAVYFGGRVGGLRAGAGNLTDDEIRRGVALCHSRGRKAFLTVNYYPRSGDLPALEAFLNQMAGIDLDGFILSDPGVLSLLRKASPLAGTPGGPEIHLSTQANVTSLPAARFWYEQGVRRLITARELSLAEIRALREGLPDDMVLEVFVQGAMCISYSGRCLLSSWMTGRDANRGDCAHPCRYRYALMEETRPGEFFPIEEDGQGAYIMNSKDLCMIEHLPALAAAGVGSVKIEGRMKSIYYVASVLRVWRQAMDEWRAAAREGGSFSADPRWMEELNKVSHRPFSTGFYFGDPGAEGQETERGGYLRGLDFLGVVLEYDGRTGMAKVEQRNKFSVGDVVEVFGPSPDFFTCRLDAILDEEGLALESAPHPQQILWIPLPEPARPLSLMRRAEK